MNLTHKVLLALTGGLLFPACLYAQEVKRSVLEVESQVLHRYVLTVEVVPKVELAPKTDESKKPAGNSYLNKRITPRKAIEYWEVVSPTPLSAQQCLNLVNAGKAKRTINPRINRDYAKIYKDGEPKNMTMEGEIDDIWDRDPYDGETHYEDPDLYEFIAD